MRRSLWITLLLALSAQPLAADTIYQTNAQGKQTIVQRDAIVVHEDDSLVVYKHFDLRERRVTKVRLFQGSLPYNYRASTPDERKQIVETWKRFGYTTTVTDKAGKTTRVYDVYLDFYPPGGRGSLLESIPARTNLPMLLDDGSADEFEFSKIARLQIQGEHLTVTLRDGTTKAGKFLMPTNQPAEVRFLGITEDYNPASEDVFDFSQPLSKLKEISFQ
ncbi:MAG: hypothetical protein LAP13_11490 [Acidobacteriia bacterium]|nr:hypothetical protein [Terriglobia bacterium]